MKSLCIKIKLLLVLAVAVLFASCSKEGPELSPQEKVLQRVCRFVYDYTSEAYLWNANIPQGVTYKSAADPYQLFEILRYKELDRWSALSDNADEQMDEFEGVSTTFGYSLAFGRFSNKPQEMFAVVEFVYEDSPARKAGIKRGDLILSLGGAPITELNYTNLYYAPQVEIGLGHVNLHGMVIDSGVKCTLTAVNMYEDPVIETLVLEEGGKKTGYVAYAGFYERSHERLVQVFRDFESAGVSELILDLRYNLGGDAKTPSYLASLFAPARNVKGKSVFLRQQWNDAYTEYFTKQGEDLNTYFAADIPVNLNLQRVYILTSSKTASASEAVISGLKPYMDVVLVGGKTYGKYCGAALLTPDSQQNADISNWMLTLVVYKFVNAEGFTDFKNGIPADHEVEDSGLLAGIPLGSKEDPLVAKALSLICGDGTKVAHEPLHLPEGISIDPSFGLREEKGGYKMVMDLK